VLIGDCTNWLAELDAAIASVILEVRDARGQLVTKASQASGRGAALSFRQTF
jgi:hypothetical protein